MSHFKFYSAQKQKLEITKQVLLSNNIKYLIFDENNLPNIKEVNSLLRIYKNIKNIKLIDNKIIIAKKITNNKIIKLSKLIEILKKYDFKYNEICYLVFFKYINSEIDI